DYGTPVRDGAGLITLISEAGLAKPAVPRLVTLLARATANKTYTSTQEQAWLLLAAHALGEEEKAMRLTVNAEPRQGTLLRSLAPRELDGDGVVIGNAGDGAVDAVVSVIGAALTPEPAVSRGFRIERTYYDLDGHKIELESANGGRGQLKQNDRLVVVLRVETEAKGGRILLVDRLPAGLEVENPRLVDAGDVKTLSWLKTTRKPNHID